MNSFKKTETVVTLFNTAALLGASIYFYRKINNLELELNKHSEHLTSTVKKVREIVVYKKHIAVLGNAIKEMNNSVGSQNRDIDTLKELVKIQSLQITELQTLIQKNLKEADKGEALEIKNKENPYLQALNPYYQQNMRPQNMRPQIQNAPMYPQQNNMESDFNFQQNQGYNRLNPPNQQGFQGMNQPQRFPVQNMNQGFHGQNQNMNSGNFNQNMNQGFPGQNMNSGNFNQNMNQGRFNQFQDEEIDDEDATIAAVRRMKANQQNNNTDDLLGGLFA